MPDFQPFRGVRYDAGRFGTDLAEVAAPPYDVIDEDRLAHLRGRHDHNAVHLTLPADDEPGDRYDRAAATLAAWLGDGMLAPDDAESFYVYRVTFEDEGGRQRTTTGVIGLLELAPESGAPVLPHERTMPKPKGDRLDLLRATRANLEPIWGLSLAEGLSSLLTVDGDPLAEVTDTRGARHRLYRLDDADRMAAVTERVAQAPVVLADGHHRYETSLHYREERRAAGEGSGPHDSIMTLVVELADEQLAVQPIHRVIRSLGDPDALRRELEGPFEVVDAGPNDPDTIEAVAAEMAERQAMALVDDSGVALLVPRPGPLQEALDAHEPPLVHGVDAARFEAAVAPVLDRLGAEVSYRHDRQTVAGFVAKGTADAAVLLRPVDVATIRAVAAEAERMPQKTTFFHPKPSTGLVFRSLDR